MTSNQTIKTINCTSCGAGLDVLGGGRVQVHVCGYCGSELDAQHNYKVLKTFADLERPDSPLKIGMVGNIQGVAFTVIGTLGLEERYGGRHWRWTDHQVFSPTHGYAYVTVEDGHLTFTRRFRDETRPAWISVQRVETAEHPPIIKTRDTNYTYYDTSTSKITFAEGEFNWQPEIGRSSTVISVMSTDSKLGFEKANGEEEITKTVYLPFDEICPSFGLESLSKPTQVHALLPYTAGRYERFLKWASAGFWLVALAFFFNLLTTSTGTGIAAKAEKVGSLPMEIPFEITEVGRSAKILVKADVSNSWAYLEVFVTDPEDVPVFETGRTVERYHGRDKDGRWSEGNGRGVVRFTPTMSGEYTLEVALGEAETWSHKGSPVSSVEVFVSQGVSAPMWMGILALAFLLFSGFQHAKLYIHNKRRWWGSDWTDD